MNILVIGNGFDLAHGLPTKYVDFLEFCKSINIIYKSRSDYTVKSFDSKYLSKLNLDGKLKELLKSDFQDFKQKVFIKNLKTYRVFECINNNQWIEYFMTIYEEKIKNGKDGWIDFESEISKVIHSLDNDRSKFDFENNIQLISNTFLNERYYDANPPITYKQLRDKLLSDLNRLIRALEIYLTEYVEKIGVEVVSPDIKNIAAISYDDRGQKGILFSKVISFNYTNIYEQIYLNRHNIDSNDYIDYIHGKADSNNEIESNYMVLGIDEYLEENKQNTQVEFIAFKKFYQRIYKETGCKYKEWVDTIKEEFADYQIELEKSKTEKNSMNLKAAVNKLKKQYLNKHHIYFFGHSLDVTDKDILRDLILNDNVHTTIFYHNKDVMGQQIANLVKVIGQDELIRRTGGSAKTIEFRQQKPMIERTEK